MPESFVQSAVLVSVIFRDHRQTTVTLEADCILWIHEQADRSLGVYHAVVVIECSKHVGWRFVKRAASSNMVEVELSLAAYSNMSPINYQHQFEVCLALPDERHVHHCRCGPLKRQDGLRGGTI